MSDGFLQVAARLRLGTLALDVGFEASAAWTVLFGASGSGKSTVLRAIAGLVRVDEGRIVLKGRTLVDTRTGECVAAHRRGARWTGQTAMLFPRMTVRENLAFGSGAGARVEEAMGHFGLRGLAEKRPGELSGGERQRVAVVGAALGEGEVLLLDEPFTGLDGGRREELIGLLREWMGGRPVISVTHDVGEAFLLGAEVVRLSEGRVVAQGAVGVVLAEERVRLIEAVGGGKG